MSGNGKEVAERIDHGRVASHNLGSVRRPFDSNPGLDRGLLPRIAPHGRAGRCYWLALGAPHGARGIARGLDPMSNL